MKKVDLIIVGAQKAGTTSLNNYLRSHPDIVSHADVEFSFFADESEYEMGFDQAFATYFDKNDYQKIVAKNVTISLREESLKRLKAHNPDVKIVFLMREPVNRAYSAYTMAVKDGWMERPFTEFHDILDKKQYDDIMYRHFVGHGLYGQQLKRMLDYFPAENIRLFLFEDLKTDPEFVSNSVFRWLGLPPIEVENQVHNPTYQPRSKVLANYIGKLRNQNNPFKRAAKSILPRSLFSKLGKQVTNLNKSEKRFEPMPEDIKRKLTTHFRPFNAELVNTLSAHKMEDNLITADNDNWYTKLLNDKVM